MVRGIHARVVGLVEDSTAFHPASLRGIRRRTTPEQDVVEPSVETLAGRVGGGEGRAGIAGIRSPEAPALGAAGMAVPSIGKTKSGSVPAATSAAAEAISALTNLGYQPGLASQAIAAAAPELGDDAETSQLIRRGLKELAR